MSITALSSVLTYTAILLGIALLYGHPSYAQERSGIILIQGASVFPVMGPVQESLAAGSGLSGWRAGQDFFFRSNGTPGTA